ncbi:hypothetical protein D3C71_2097730 [compost metagenome]
MAVKAVTSSSPPTRRITSTDAESGSAKLPQSGNTICAQYDTTRNNMPPISDTARIATGMR